MKMTTNKVQAPTKVKVNLNEARDLGLELAIKSAKLLLKKQKQISSLKITTKTAQGIASEADTESEKIVIQGIKKKYPSHFILAEESAYKEYNGAMERYKFLKEKEWVWIIDPLDGTNNYLNGLDYFGICISLTHFGEPVVGIVLRPSNGECFVSIKNKGSKLFKYSENFKKISAAKILKQKKRKRS